MIVELPVRRLGILRDMDLSGSICLHPRGMKVFTISGPEVLAPLYKNYVDSALRGTVKRAGGFGFDYKFVQSHADGRMNIYIHIYTCVYIYMYNVYILLYRY